MNTTVQTYSIVAGSMACNARCAFCISGMTPQNGIESKLPETNWRNFDIGAKLAKDWGAVTAMITSKGEPTLYPGQVTEFLEHLQPHGYPLVEMQTNGIKLVEPKYEEHLDRWYELGLTTVAVSVVHYDDAKNKEIYEPHKKKGRDLSKLIEKLHEKKFSVRLTCTMLDGYIDNAEEVEKLITYARENNVEQLTIRPVEKPVKSRDNSLAVWTGNHQVSQDALTEIHELLETKGTKLRELAHGAVVYDYNGQNICLSNCLTIEADSNEIRQLIFFPDGHVRYDWQHEGALLL